MRKSIKSTYDSRETGNRYAISTYICDIPNTRESIPDPFVNVNVKLGFLKAVRYLLLYGYIKIGFIVEGDDGIVEDVLELDENYLGQNSSRRSRFNKQVNSKLRDM